MKVFMLIAGAVVVPLVVMGTLRPPEDASPGTVILFVVWLVVVGIFAGYGLYAYAEESERKERHD